MTTTTGTSIMPPAVGVRPEPIIAARRTRSRSGWLGLRARIAIGIVVLAAAVLVGMRYFVPAAIGPGAETFSVTQRDFGVVLHEKGELKAAKSIDVKSEVEGRCTIIWLIPEGTEVKEGDLLVKLASQDIEDKVRSESIKEANAKASAEAADKEYEITVDEQASNVRKAELAVHNARIELDKYLKGDWEEQKTDAELEVKRAEEELRRANDKLADSEDLFKKNFVTEMERDNDRFAVFEAEIALQKAKLKREILGTYTHPKDVGQKQSDLAEAEKELARAKKSHDAKISQSSANKDAKASEYEFTRQQLEKFQRQKSKTEIKAPAAGLVVYYSENSRWGNEGQIAEGKEVYERQTIISLPDTAVMQVLVRIHEAKADKVKLEQLARVEVEGLPGVVLTGKVTKIAPLADSQNRWLNPDLKEYQTEITLDSFEVNLKPGVTARAEIIVDEVRNALAVPIQAVVTRQGKRFVFQGRSFDPTPVQVELGRSNEQFVEVLKGLSAGDRVRLAITESDLKLLPESPEERMKAPTEEVVTGGEAPAVKTPKPEVRRPEAAATETGRGSENRKGEKSGPRPGGGGGGDRGGRPSRPGRPG